MKTFLEQLQNDPKVSEFQNKESLPLLPKNREYLEVGDIIVIPQEAPILTYKFREGGREYAFLPAQVSREDDSIAWIKLFLVSLSRTALDAETGEVVTPQGDIWELIRSSSDWEQIVTELKCKTLKVIKIETVPTIINGEMVEKKVYSFNFI